jgi:predicted enzyme related to lactoylglutathione lyase
VASPEPTGPTVFFGVEDLDAAIARVRELGGEAGEKQEIPGIGFYAQCMDTEGNPIGLYQDAS